MKKTMVAILMSLISICIFTTQVTAEIPKKNNAVFENKMSPLNTINPENIGTIIKAHDSGKESLKEHQKKLSTDLLRLTDKNLAQSNITVDQIKNKLKNQKSLIAANEAISKGFKATNDDLVYVYIHLNSGINTKVVDTYVNTVINRDEKNNLVVAWVSVEKLELLALLQDVYSIQTVMPPVVNSGNVNSEGDQILKADLFRNKNSLDGAGIKVGIISNGANHWADAAATGDLPNNVHILRDSLGGDEGTAMLEIVHDLAPGAELYFHDCGGDIVGFNMAIDSLVDAGCQVICDDVGWPTEPFFEDGPVAAHVKSVLESKNIVYVSAAGNSAETHYQGAYRDYTGTSSNGTQIHFHDFGSEAGLQPLPVWIPAGGDIGIYLEWNDKFGASNNDYDAFLVDENYVLAESRNTQDGNDDPLETLSYHNDTGSGKYAYVVIVKAYGASKVLELYVYGGEVSPYYNTGKDSIFGHPAVPNVIAVGAINATNPNTIAPYSSRGPITISYPTAQTRNKPDVCGIDGVSITGAGGFENPFYGTSAAAPHIAAVAALLWSQSPTKSSAEIRSMICSGTKDMGVAGCDNIYGNGLEDVLIAGVPSKPTGFAVLPGDTSAITTWIANSEPDINGYQLEYKAATANTWKAIQALPTATTYKITGLINGNQYDFRIKAKDKGGNWSAYSDIVSVTPLDNVPPPTPIGLNISSVNDKQAVLSWTAVTAADLSGYQLEYMTADDNAWTEIKLGKVITYTVTGLTNEKQYTFRIKAQDTSNNWSGYSATVAGTPIDKIPPGVPIGLSAVIGSHCDVTLSWNGNTETDLGGYEISYQKYGTTNLEIADAGAETTSKTIDLASNTKYTFKMRAKDLKGNWSNYSAPITVTTPVSTITPTLDGAFKEGEEDKKIITISLANGIFVDDLKFDPSKIQLTGMPTGIIKGETTRLDDHTVTISLIGNSTGDYDTNVNVTVMVDKDEVLPSQPASLTAALPFIATVEPVPPAPDVTFSFIGDDAGKLMGIKENTMEYSLDGGVTYNVAQADNLKLTDTESALINPVKDIKVRVKATLRNPSGQINTIDILSIPVAPVITFSFSGSNNGTLSGSTTAMEYSIDGGITYNPVTESNMKLSSETLESIKADKDLKVRVKQMPRAPAGLIKTIDILPAPVQPNLIKNDNLNTLTGMTTSMEFRMNDNSVWTKYTGSNLPSLSGNATLIVRVAAAGVTIASPVTSLSYTPDPPLDVKATFTSSLTEGLETGKVISVVLTNGEFVTSINPTEIVLSGLPAGVGKGTITRINKSTVNISLVGNSTADYDTDQNISILIKKSQILPTQQTDINVTIIMPATVEPTPVAPNIIFSFDGVNARKLLGSTTLMEYSVDGGLSYLPVTMTNMVLTSAQIAAVNHTNDIKVRLKKTLRVPAGSDAVLDILEGKALEGVTSDDAANRMAGMTVTPAMEFSTNGGTTWTKYTGTNLPSLIGGVVLKVRYAATGMTEAGQIETYTFTAT